MKTHYELLGIEPTASPENIRASYLRAIAFYHPDRNKSKDAIEMTQLLNEAYDTLKDPRKKNDYDSMLVTRLLTGDPQQTPPQEPEPTATVVKTKPKRRQKSTNSKDKIREIRLWKPLDDAIGVGCLGILAIIVMVIIVTIVSN